MVAFRHVLEEIKNEYLFDGVVHATTDDEQQHSSCAEKKSPNMGHVVAYREQRLLEKSMWCHRLCCLLGLSAGLVRVSSSVISLLSQYESLWNEEGDGGAENQDTIANPYGQPRIYAHEVRSEWRGRHSDYSQNGEDMKEDICSLGSGDDVGEDGEDHGDGTLATAADEKCEVTVEDGPDAKGVGVPY